MTDFEAEMLAQVSAAKLASRHMLAAVLLALGENRALDVGVALGFVDTLAVALRQPFGVSDPTTLRAMRLAAGEMAELRPAMLRMVTVPAGAGTA